MIKYLLILPLLFLLSGCAEDTITMKLPEKSTCLKPDYLAYGMRIYTDANTIDVARILKCESGHSWDITQSSVYYTVFVTATLGEEGFEPQF